MRQLLEEGGTEPLNTVPASLRATAGSTLRARKNPTRIIGLGFRNLPRSGLVQLLIMRTGLAQLLGRRITVSWSQWCFPRRHVSSDLHHPRVSLFRCYADLAGRLSTSALPDDISSVVTTF